MPATESDEGAVLVYDDECGFCTWWADLFAEHADVRIVGFSELTDDQRARLPEDYEECSHLLTADAVYSCGASIEQAFARVQRGPDVAPLFDFLRQFDDYEDLRERLYRAVADRRDTLGHVVRKEPPAEQN